MKTKLQFKVLLLLLIPVLYFVITAGFKEKEIIIGKAISIADNPVTKDFINLIFNDQYFGRNTPTDPRAIENNLNKYGDSLHFNSIHVYGYGSSGGGFDDSISTYSNYINGLIKQVNDSGFRGFYGRNKIEQLSYGQRLEYEIADTNLSRLNYGFCYDSIMSDTYGTDSGKTVLHAVPYPATGYDSAGWLCRKIYENLQHGDLVSFTQLDTGTWFIKPVMRIDSTIVDSNPEDSVVRIDVINYKGNIIKSVKIKSRNFARFDPQSSAYVYSGNYINIFDFALDPQNNLLATGERYNSNGLNNGMRDNTWSEWKDSCKVDFKVWWYGKVEVWFDKMVVDDFWGDQLFSSDSITRSLMESKITEEASAFADKIHARDGYFYIDEILHSNIPCIKRVKQLLQETNQNAKLNFAQSNYLNVKGYKNNLLGQSSVLDQIKPESFMADAYEFKVTSHFNIYISYYQFHNKSY